jgi:hypothetical protein
MPSSTETFFRLALLYLAPQLSAQSRSPSRPEKDLSRLVCRLELAELGFEALKEHGF